MSAERLNIPPALQEQIRQLQQLDQQYRSAVIQTEQLSQQLREVESSLKELEALPDDAMVFKAAGTVMFESPASQVKEELEDKKEIMSLHKSTIEKSGTRTKKKLDELQKKVQQQLQAPGQSGLAG
ncbi:MAG: prefoldin subunit beta [Candidatus Hodarchaeales archaeon]|jgi:prefoldin beta subunit